MTSTPGTITDLLLRWRPADPNAFPGLVALTCDDFVPSRSGGLAAGDRAA